MVTAQISSKVVNVSPAKWMSKRRKGGRSSWPRHCGYRSHKLSGGREEGGGSLFMTAGLLVSAHRAQGQHP